MVERYSGIPRVSFELRKRLWGNEIFMKNFNDKYARRNIENILRKVLDLPELKATQRKFRIHLEVITPGEEGTF